MKYTAPIPIRLTRWGQDMPCRKIYCSAHSGSSTLHRSGTCLMKMWQLACLRKGAMSPVSMTKEFGMRRGTRNGNYATKRIQI